jgi:hypothetical protein
MNKVVQYFNMAYKILNDLEIYIIIHSPLSSVYSLSKNLKID